MPKKFAVQKLATQVDTVAWNDQSDMLAVISDSRLFIYYYPHALYVDKDLLKLTLETQDGAEFGKIPQIQTFFGTTITVRRGDGALLASTGEISPKRGEVEWSGVEWSGVVRGGAEPSQAKQEILGERHEAKQQRNILQTN